MPNLPTHASIEGDPVPSFDNQSSASQPVIELLTLPEAAALLRVSKTSIRRLQRARQLPFIKVGGSVRFYRGDLAAYVAEHRIEALDAKTSKQ
jgi:excisionase family DNA binding protein